jgi:hypothetical protein
MLTSIKFRGHALSCGTINWLKILSDDHTRAMYNKHLLMLMTEPTQWDDHQELILQAGALTATTHKCQYEGWFQISRSALAPLYTERNTLKHAVKHASHLPPAILATMQFDLKRLTRHISHAVSHAKATWYADICQKIHDMWFDPRLAWEHIRLLTKGKTAHHNKLTNMAMRLPNGNKVEVFGPHFHNVFNNHRSTDHTVLEHVPQQRTMWELNDPITWEEFRCAVKKLKNGKAAGLICVPAEAFKAMCNANLLHIYKHVNDFFVGTADHEQWHRSQSQCVPVPKSGDLSDPNKWCGIMLMGVGSKIFSSVMNEQAFKLLDKSGTKFQFGGTPELGCRDGLFVLKTMLILQKITICHPMWLLLILSKLTTQPTTITFSSTSLNDMAPLHTSSRL